MIHLMGKCMLLVGCAALGVRHALELKRRTFCLEGFRTALEILERELAFASPPVAVLLSRMQEGSRGPARAFLETCAARFQQGEDSRWTTAWRETLEEAQLPIRPEDRRLLAETADVLGKYDEDSQRLAVRRLLVRLEEQIGLSREEAKRMGRVFGTLGVAGGLFCMILL